MDSNDINFSEEIFSQTVIFTGLFLQFFPVKYIIIMKI